jgi:hypothetical protein
MTDNPDDLRRAKALQHEDFPATKWEDADEWVKDECLRQARAIRASDDAAGLVMVPRVELTKISQLINEQAEDDMLWFQAVTITEAHLQNELRQLTTFVEAMIAAHEGGDGDGK